MEAVPHSCWSLPTEVLTNLLALVPYRSVINFEAASKAQQQQFEQYELYKHLSCRLFHWGSNDAKQVEQSTTEKINWRAEFIISSIHHDTILSNRLVHDTTHNKDAAKLMPEVAPNHFNFVSNNEEEEFHMLFRSEKQLYPHPLGDFTVAYYEVNLISRKDNAQAQFAVGAALDGYIAFAGVGRNSFAYTIDGQVLLELDIAPADQPPINVGDTIGFGIDFKTRAVFWTLNGQLVCTKTHNYWQERLLNLETLHVSVSCGHGFEFSINFGASPFLFDIRKHQQNSQRESADRLNDDNSADKNVLRDTYSMTMLHHVLKYIEEDTLTAIADKDLRFVSLFDFNPPSGVYHVDINPLWICLLFPNDGDNGLMDVPLEFLATNLELFLEWKDDKKIQMMVKKLFDEFQMPYETTDTYEDLVNRLHDNAHVFWFMRFFQTIKRFEDDIRQDFVQDDIAAGWALVVTAFNTIVTNEQLPIDHYLVQASLCYLDNICKTGFPKPITQENASTLVSKARYRILSLRLKTLQLIILDKNSNKKEDFEKRNVKIQELYRHRVAKDTLDLTLQSAPIPTVPLRMNREEQKKARIDRLLTTLSLIEHYDVQDDFTKSRVILDAIGMLRIPEEKVTSESELLAEAKQQIIREVPAERRIERLEDIRSSVVKEDYEPEVVKNLARTFGLDVEADIDRLREQIKNKLDKDINQIKKKPKQQISLKTQLLIGSGIGLLLGLGAAFFVHRRNAK